MLSFVWHQVRKREERNNWVSRPWVSVGRTAQSGSVWDFRTQGADAEPRLDAAFPAVKHPWPSILCSPSCLSKALIATSRRELGKKKSHLELEMPAT